MTCTVVATAYRAVRARRTSMSKQPSPRADALQAMREARFEREQERQKAERKATPEAAPAEAAGSRKKAKPVKTAKATKPISK
jgi:hypothetical protein